MRTPRALVCLLLGHRFGRATAHRWNRRPPLRSLPQDPVGEHARQIRHVELRRFTAGQRARHDERRVL